jgi:uncharacterized membrane protein
MGNFLRFFYTLISLSFFNIVIVLGPLLGLVSLWLASWGVCIGFIFSPLIIVIKFLIYRNSLQWFNAFSSLLLCGVGLLILIGNFFTTKVFINGIKRYLKFNVSLVKGGLSNDN